MDIGLMSPDELAAELGGRVRSERLRRNWTQQTLAERSGVSRWTVTRMEAGDSVALSNFLAVLVALGRSDDLDQVLRPAEAQTIEGFVGSAGPSRRRGRQ